MSLWGIGWTAATAETLLSDHLPHELGWRGLLLVISGIWLICEFPRWKNSSQSNAGCLLMIPFLAGWVLVYSMRSSIWAPPATGILVGALLWSYSKAGGLSYPFIPIAGMLAGVAALYVPWPNEDRCGLAVVGSGIAITLQGAWIIILHVLGRKAAPVLDDTGRPGGDRTMIRSLRLLLGSLDPWPIIDPAFEQRIRDRFRAASDELAKLGFYYLSCEGSTLSLFRVPLLVPAILVVEMLWKREPMRIQGFKILAGNPVLVSRDKGTTQLLLR